MAFEDSGIHFPDYQQFVGTIYPLALPISGSEIHGVMCGYLCAAADSQGEAYLRALLVSDKKSEDLRRNATLVIYGLYHYSQQQINAMDFAFQMLLPEEHEPLIERAKAFSEWCQGFTEGLTMAGIHYEQFQEEESREALQHMIEFAELDYESLDVDDADEKALMEVTEYARMAVLRLYADIYAQNKKSDLSDTAH